MADKNWKATERRIAACLGMRRVPVTGRHEGGADIEGVSWLSVEIKHRRSLPAWIKDAVKQAVKSARGELRLPIAILHQQFSKQDGDLVVMRFGDFKDWFLSTDAVVRRGHDFADDAVIRDFVKQSREGTLLPVETAEEEIDDSTS